MGELNSWLVHTRQAQISNHNNAHLDRFYVNLSPSDRLRLDALFNARGKALCCQRRTQPIKL